MSFSPDVINGTFEFLGGALITVSILRVLADKKVAGVSWLTVAFFMSWGYWNLFYYPHLEQWMSFAGGVFLVAANTIWVALLIYYSRSNA